jgi:hypothetical protein
MQITPVATRTAFVGDIHGRLGAFEYTLASAINRGVVNIVQVGDFWIYDRPRELDKLERFIDGNHENFAVLDPVAPGPVALSEHVTYMPRGTRSRIGGAELLFCGGASSVDRKYRTEGKDWWPAENLTLPQIERAEVSAFEGPVDVLVTHETTTAAFDGLLSHGGHARDKINDPAGTRNRELLSRLAAVARDAGAGVHVHGHHHTAWTGPGAAGLTDIALSLEQSAGSVVILDTADPGNWTWTTTPGRRATGADIPLPV